MKITLAAARVNANMTQEEVAKKLHVSNKSVVNWENGKVDPSYATLLALCNLYGCPINCIILPEKSTISEQEE